MIAAIKVSGVKDGLFDGFESFHAALIPDQRTTYGIDVRCAACVKKQTELTFAKGVLTKVHIDKQSEIVDCLEIPLEALKKIVAVPGELLKSEKDNLVAERALLDAEKSLLQSQRGLRDFIEQQTETGRDPSGS